MKSKSIPHHAIAALLVFVSVAIGASPAASQTFTVLHNFGAPGDGAQPISGLVLDQQGNLYGQTDFGGPAWPYCGSQGCGIVYQLTPNPDGSWRENVLHSFIGFDGAGGTLGAPAFDSHGNLFSTTGGGGNHRYGTVFELTPSDGTWRFSSLYSYRNSSDGWEPSALVVYKGSLYATSSWGGGQNDQGAVIALSQSSPSTWSERSLHDFNTGNDGWLPNGLVFDSNGNAYGTTFYGGAQNQGTVYNLAQDPITGRWSESIIYEFIGFNGSNPSASLVLDSAGNLYSTTLGGGIRGGGTVFELMSNSDGTWSEKILYSFDPGEAPYAGVTFDQSGNLYGDTEGSGRVYKFTPSSHGEWTATILHQFDGSDGAYPFANVILDSADNVYGTTQLGGTYNGGVTFKISQ